MSVPLYLILDLLLESAFQNNIFYCVLCLCHLVLLLRMVCVFHKWPVTPQVVIVFPTRSVISQVVDVHFVFYLSAVVNLQYLLLHFRIVSYFSRVQKGRSSLFKRKLLHM